MLGKAMEKWPDDSLRRVVDAPVEAWFDPEGCVASGWWETLDPNVNMGVCPYGFAADEGETWEACYARLRPDDRFARPWRESVPFRYDSLVNRFGGPRTVRAIKQRALRILLDRHPLDSKLVVLHAETSAP